MLYIEDNAANLRLVERILARQPGVRLLAAVDGTQGLQIARQQRPKLILLDQMLPDMNGEDVLYALQQDPSTREIPVVIVSADAHAEMIGKMLAAGASSYLTKPLNVAEFLAVVEQHLDETIATSNTNT